ncbi:integrase catalytic domain-containing protein [Xylanibacter muris]|uniref:integrase catalytic domain-containing protein n=1 Tax=Xylanibacter muris TaxID=2736290 RepID=UPI0025A1ECE8|nr:transposase family protein [Xylanibacter muris]
MGVCQSIAAINNDRIGAYTRSLYGAAMHDRSLYLTCYRNNTPDLGKAVAQAEFHAALMRAYGLYKEGVASKNSSSLGSVYAAFNTIYPGKYSYHRFAHNMRRIETEGAQRLVIDRRSGNNHKINDVVKKWLLDAMSSGKKYGPTSICRMIDELCGQYGYKAPSLSWVKTNYYKMLPLVTADRCGNDEQTYNELPYAGILRASAPGGQWQIDGWRLPFYMDGFRTLPLFAVMDALSGRIVGYHVDRTENTETILKGIENAVNNTGTLPREIVSDNHSFNQTKEADNFKAALAKMGCTWTVTQNPRYKGIVERSFGTFGETFCKPMYGYIGQSIRSRRANSRTSQDLMTKYTRSGYWLTEDQIKLIAVQLVEQYNSTCTGKRTESPDAMYRNTNNIGIPVDFIHRIALFTRKGLYKVKKGQINIERSGIVYEYQLNAEQFGKLNGKTVAVRYVDRDMIYLFDDKTDESLGSVPRKRYAHGALCDQTEDDIAILNQYKGHLNGIKTAIKRQQNEIAERAISMDPEAAYAMNPKLTPKNIIESMKENGRIVSEARRLGVDPELVTNIPVFSEVSTCGLESRKSKRDKESPFAPLNHEIKTFK